MNTDFDQHQNQISNQVSSGPTFKPGASVIYGIHGRCQIAAIETKKIGGEEIKFYKLEIQRPAASRSKKRVPAIWLPVANAESQGLRKPLDADDCEDIFSILENREYYFSPKENFKKIQPQLEKTVNSEGAIGMAKVISYLHVIMQKYVIAPDELQKAYDPVFHVLVREIAEATQNSIRSIEDRIEKGLRHKLLPDN